MHRTTTYYSLASVLALLCLAELAAAVNGTALANSTDAPRATAVLTTPAPLTATTRPITTAPLTAVPTTTTTTKASTTAPLTAVSNTTTTTTKASTTAPLNTATTTTRAGTTAVPNTTTAKASTTAPLTAVPNTTTAKASTTAPLTAVPNTTTTKASTTAPLNTTTTTTKAGTTAVPNTTTAKASTTAPLTAVSNTTTTTAKTSTTAGPNTTTAKASTTAPLTAVPNTTATTTKASTTAPLTAAPNTTKSTRPPHTGTSNGTKPTWSHTPNASRSTWAPTRTPNTTKPTTSATSGSQTAPGTDGPYTEHPGNRTEAPTVPHTQTPTAPFTHAPCKPNITLAMASTYTFVASRTARVYLGPVGGTRCGLTPIVMWKVGTLSVQGSVFTSQLPAGTYQGSVSVTLGTNNVTSAETQASFTIVVTPPPATIQIRGGDRQVAVGSSITFVAAATSAKTVSWSCCVYGDNGACASATCTFTSSMLSTAFVGKLAAGFPAAGKYVVTATSDVQVSATVNVLVFSANASVNIVQLQTGASSSVYVGTRITIVAQAAKGSSYTWTATDGTMSNGYIANFKPTTSGPFSVTVTATSKAGVAGTASLSFTVMPLPTGTLTVTSTDSPIVGDTSSLTLTLSQWTGPSTATFRFGYLQYGQWNALSDDFGTTTTQTYTAPLVLGNRSIVFAVQALMGKQRPAPITSVVPITAPDNPVAAVAERQAAMTAAAAAKDISTVLRDAQDVVGLTGTGSADDASVASAAVAAVASVVTTSMSSTDRDAVVDVLASALTNSTLTDSATTDVNTQKQVIQCLAAVLFGANATDASSTDSIDASTRAASTLALIDTLNANAMASDASNRDARQQLARNLALTVAAQLSVGQTTTVQSSDMSITAVSVPVSASQPTAVSTPQASISISLAALASAMAASVDVVAQSGTNVAVSATSHATNPVPTAKTPSGSNISSAIVEFDVTASGASFSSLSSPITIRLQANATKDGKPPACVYFDATSNTWSTAGVVTTDYNASDNTVGCSSTHLSLFAAAAPIVEAFTTTTTASSPTDLPSVLSGSGSDNTKYTILYVAIGICVLIILILTGIIIRRHVRGEEDVCPPPEPKQVVDQQQQGVAMGQVLAICDAPSKGRRRAAAYQV